MKNFYLPLTLLFLLQTIPAQNTPIESSYINYFQNSREIPHLHLNKTTFLKGEEVWFQAYVLEQNSQKLHPTSSNLYVSVFDDTGVLKDQQLIALNNGIGNGQIYIDSTYTQDTYYLKASTNWMQNFNEDNSFTQKITLASSEKKIINKSLSEGDFFEFKLFPEGGHILANTMNNIGILIKNSNNKGIKIKKGIVKNSEGKIIEEFSTNHLGFGKMQLLFDEGQVLTFEATLSNGSVIRRDTPKARAYGLTTNLINNDTDVMTINILTNEKSLNYLSGKKYRIFIHNTSVYKTFFFEFNETDKTYTLSFKKEDLPYGMNIITIFNENNKPIIERLAFNDTNQLYTNVEFEKIKAATDSLELKLTNRFNENLSLSTSFLPAETKSYNPTNSMLSSMLLKPFVNGYIETPQYYFADKKRLGDLELLLLTQGWSKYKWGDIFNKPPTTNFEFENGIDVTATLNTPLRKKQAVLIYSKDNNLVAQIKPNESPFILKNSFIKKNSTVDFTLISNSNRYEARPALSYSKSKLYDAFDLTKKEPTLRNELVVSNFKDLAKDVEVLDEAEVKANKRISDNEVFGGVTMLRRIKMENIIIGSGETVLDFLRYKGFQITTGNDGAVSIFSRGIAQFSPIAINASPGLDRPGMLVTLDEADISRSLWMLQNMYLDRVKEIFYGRMPDKLFEEIHIFTLAPQEYLDKNAKYSHVKIPIGFATEKEYYSPKYPSFMNATYKHYGAIYWKPNITLKANSSTTIKIPLNGQNELKIYTEGISSSGKLITKENLVSID